MHALIYIPDIYKWRHNSIMQVPSIGLLIATELLELKAMHPVLWKWYLVYELDNV